MPENQWDEDFRELLTPGTGPTIQDAIYGVFANAPNVTVPFFTFAAAMVQGMTLRPRLMEMIRLRIAFHNQCRSCMAMRYSGALDDGLTEDTVCSLEKPAEAPDLTEAEKAVLQFADYFATNHLLITDDTVEGLRQFYTEKHIIEIGIYCAYCVGFGRFATTYRAIEDLPESYTDMTTRTAPWERSHTERVVMPRM